MFTIPERLSSVTKENLAAHIAMISELTAKTFESVEKIVDLNMNIARNSLEESTDATKQLLSAKDPQEFFTLTTAQGKINAEKTFAYGRRLVNIASTTQAEFQKMAEKQVAETNRKVLFLIEEATKNAPAGGENMVAMIKSAIGNANAGYEQLTKTTKQVVNTFDSNIQNSANKSF